MHKTELDKSSSLRLFFGISVLDNSGILQEISAEEVFKFLEKLC